MRKYGHILRTGAIKEVEEINDNEECSYSKLYKQITDSLISSMEFEEQFSCPDCDMSFSRKTRLSFHFFTVHRKLFAYQCKICDCKRNEKYKVRNHVSKDHKIILPEGQILTNDEVVEELRRFSASIERRFFRKFGKVYEKLYECEFCQMKSTTKKGLRRHIRTYHKRLAEDTVFVINL